MNYKERMKLLRTYELLTQEDIARVLKINRSTYKEYELQNSIIPIKHLNDFCNYFNTSIDYIFKFTESKKYNESRKEVNKSLFSNRLKELRKEYNLKQQDLADILKIDNSTISKYERKINIIATPFLYDICKKYNISADYLLGKIDSPKYLNK